MADTTVKDETGAAASVPDRFQGLDNVMAAARDLAVRLRDTSVAIGEYAEQELSFAVDVAEQMRDRAVTPELLKEARALPVLRGLRVTSHRVVDLGFDAVSVGVKLGADTFEDLIAPRDRANQLAAVARTALDPA